MTTEAVRARDASPTWLPWALLAVGVCVASVAAILIRYASPAGADPLDLAAWRASDHSHPLAVSFWRCAAAAAVLAPWALRRVRARPARDWRLPAVAGVFLALHFATWITSLALTTVAASVLLVTTTPVFVAIAAYLLLRERLSRAGWTGIALTVAGSALIGGGDLGGRFDASVLAGDALALAGAVTVGGYALAGQVARRHLGIVEYAFVTYAVAAAALLPVCVAAGIPLGGYSSQAWWAIAGLVAGPQLVGHTALNLVLKDIDATTVSVAVMAEPVVATVLAYVLFDEVPSALLYPGGAAILAGIYLVSTMRRPPPVVVE
ncbi:MAG TPA: DMT family transporter [Actinomycetota bacterium]|nr:DMT family transporter [Actinomycetota bacterium]